MLDGILENPIIKATLMKQLKKAFGNDGVKLITISIKPDGELDFGIYKEDQKVLSLTDFNNLVQSIEL